MLFLSFGFLKGAPVLFVVCFLGIALAIFGVFCFMLVSGIAQWHKNNNSPVLTVGATVVTKRMDMGRGSYSHPRGHCHGHGHHHLHHHSPSSYYYVTFEMENGDRIELGVSGKEYGLLAERDTGRLTFQGTRYKGFERARR